MLHTALLGVAAAAVLLASPAAASDFSGERAMELLTAQCELGPRFPGSPGHELLRVMIEEHAADLGLSCVRLCFDQADPSSGDMLRLCNLVVVCGPEEGESLWLGAHYDSRPWCDRESDPEAAAEPLVGANDGASGVAVLLHLTELLAADPPPRPVALIYFDGEDSGLAGDVSGFCLGSRHLARRWNDFGSPLAGPHPEGLIVLDMVGERGLDIPQEPMSLRYAGDWVRTVFDRASELGLSAFRSEPGRPVYDDHIPFLEKGIRAVDLIDFDFPEWHTRGDVPAVCDPASLEQVGTLVLDLALNPLAGP